MEATGKCNKEGEKIPYKCQWDCWEHLKFLDEEVEYLDDIQLISEENQEPLARHQEEEDKKELIEGEPIVVETAVHETTPELSCLDAEINKKKEMASKKKSSSGPAKSAAQLNIENENKVFNISIRSHIVQIADKHIMYFMQEAIALTQDFSQVNSSGK